MNLQTLHAVTLFLTAALLVRLVVEGLHGRYRAFFASLLFTLLSGAYLYFIPVKSNLYGLVFFGSTAVSWVLQFLVLRELCLLVFHDHPGIRAAVKIGIWVSLAVAVVIPLGILGIDKLRDAPSQFPILKRFFLLNQSVMFFLSVLFAGTVAIVTWFPVALRRNIVFYCFGFSITFIGESAALLLRNAVASPYWLDLAAQAHMLIGLTVVVIWLIWLNKAGEQPLVSVSTLLRPGQSTDTLQLLGRINSFLSAVLPKQDGDKNNFRK